MTKILINIVLISLLFIGCSQIDLVEKAGLLQYSVSIGKTTGEIFRIQTASVLNKHNYIIDRYDRRSGVLVIQTEWMFRLPFPEESENNIRECKTRLIIEARSQLIGGKGLGGADLYKVRLRCENMVIRENSSIWEFAPLCEEHLNEIKYLSNELKFEYLSRPLFF